MFAKILRLFFCCASLAYYATAWALPPLGLTQISTDSELQPNLEIIDGTAYMGVTGGVWTIDASGSQTFVPISHPMLGTPSSVTRVVKAHDNNLYFAANFGTSTRTIEPALFALRQPAIPILTWGVGYNAVGVDARLQTAATRLDFNGSEATLLLTNGTVQPLPHPPGSNGNNNSTNTTASTPNGYVLGDAGIPGTAGLGPAIWDPATNFEFLDHAGLSTSIRDRVDGQGVNIGWNDYSANVKYGSEPAVRFIREQNGQIILTDERTIVSQSEFAVVVAGLSLPSAPHSFYGYFPGIVPNHEERALPLFDIFPRLTTIDVDRVYDLASIDGYLYMTLSGSDGTFLFGARDPSVAVPEPAAAALTLFMAAFALQRKRIRGIN